MITLLHGDNTEASRAELVRMKQAVKGREVRELDGRTLDVTTLAQALQSSSLFGSEVLVVIERLGKKPIRIPESAGTDVVVWEDKEVSATVIKSLGPHIQVKLFKIPQLIFQFLDSLRPKSAKTLIPVYQKLIETEPPELVFTMITRRLRQLIMIADGVTPEGLQGWQVGKLTSQAKSFSMNTLLAMYKKLLDLEYSLKTGATPFTLVQLTEQFLIDF